MRLRDRPGGHEAAGAPSKNRQAIWVCPALRDSKISRAVHVAVRAVAKMLIDRLEKSRAVARRPAILRLQHHVSESRDQPREKIEVERVVAFWPAVGEDEEPILLARLIVARKSENAFQLCSVLCGPVHHANLAQPHAGQRVVSFVRDPLELTLTRHRHVRGVCGIGNSEHENVGRGRERRKRRRRLHDSTWPAIRRFNLFVAVRVDFGHRTLVRFRPDIVPRIAPNAHDRALQFRRAIDRLTARNGHGP